MRPWMLVGIGWILGCTAMGLTWSAWTGEPTIAQATVSQTAPDRPNRGDAQGCLINRELRILDPKSLWLPENGHHVPYEWRCPDEPEKR